MARGTERPSADPVQLLFELSLDMLGTASAEGRFTLLNPAWEKTLGWTPEELKALPIESFLHPDDVAASLEQAERLQGPGSASVVSFENRARTKAGDYRCLQWATVAEDGVSYFVVKDVTEAREADRLVHRSEELHRTLTANLPDTTMFLIDHDLRILVADGAGLSDLGWIDESMFLGRKVTELQAEVPDDVLELSVRSYRAALLGERRAFEFVSEGSTFAVQAVPIRADDGTVESALVVARDISERTRAEMQIARRARQHAYVAELGRFALQSRDLDAVMNEAVANVAAALEVEAAGVLQLEPDGETLTVGASAGQPQTAVGVTRIPLSESPQVEQALRTGSPTIAGDSLTVVIEGGGRRPFGVLRVHAREDRGFSEDDAAFLAAVATLIRVAVERDRSEEATRHAASHDPLTGLANRTLALERLSEALARRRADGTDVAVLALDLDRFKLINDSIGHAAGDEVLLALAPRLTEAVGPGDTVARMGSDEFVVICPDAGDVTALAERLTAVVNRPVELTSGEHFFTVSIGIALAGPDHDKPEVLLGDADAAMYRAKERGRGRHVLFDEAMRTSVVARVRTENELRRALHSDDELVVYYQPMIDLATGLTVSTEALVRWEHPARGLLSPREFIPIAEETGLIAALGLWVLEQACRQTAAWQRELGVTLSVSVNVSGRQAVNPAFPAQVASIAERSGLRPGTLALEITETVLMDDAETAAVALETLHEHGLTLVLDDFGTGYSSLSRLKRFPLDVLKVDRSFVSGVETNADDRAIVRATIDMAHALGLTVVAEGVETAEQEEYLRACGCDRAQGYLYARPQPARAMAELLAAPPPAG